ncbi:MAG TPA: hypothetical protein VGI28_13880, partial [Stellaceae bacterium]
SASAAGRRRSSTRTRDNGSSQPSSLLLPADLRPTTVGLNEEPCGGKSCGPAISGRRNLGNHMAFPSIETGNALKALIADLEQVTK